MFFCLQILAMQFIFYEIFCVIVFPGINNINNNLLMFDRSNQIAHATTVGMYNYTGIDPTTRAFLEKTDAGPPREILNFY